MRHFSALPQLLGLAVCLAVVTLSIPTAATVLGHNKHRQISKYDIKSAIVTFDHIETQNGKTDHTKEIVYFDDFGMTECHEIYDMNSGSPIIREKTFGKDMGRYHCDYKTNTASWDEYDSSGVVPRYDLKEGSAALKKDENYKEIPNETICGKSCIGCSCKPTPDGEILCFGWKHIMMKMTFDYPKAGNSRKLIATSIKENAPIAREIFMVPSGMGMDNGK